MTESSYHPGFFIGSEDETGAHMRGTDGWPYSIYRQASAIGQTDAVLCNGIQDLADAEQLLALCNGTIRPPLARPNQMFAWN